MRHLFTLAAGALLISAVALQAAPRLDPEQKLARAVQGRVAGAPVRCLDLRTVRLTKIINRTAIIYDAGNTVYVNRPGNAEALDEGDTLVTRTALSQLCSVDRVQLWSSRIWTGSVVLSEFVPYRRAR